ncbi:diacylglycerol kinase, partial [Paraburkholderia sp. Se-20369]|nr:diacylglycerol kinase [Paraburkholderia sp. Se-20369]
MKRDPHDHAPPPSARAHRHRPFDEDEPAAGDAHADAQAHEPLGTDDPLA